MIWFYDTFSGNLRNNRNINGCIKSIGSVSTDLQYRSKTLTVKNDEFLFWKADKKKNIRTQEYIRLFEGISKRLEVLGCPWE